MLKDALMYLIKKEEEFKVITDARGRQWIGYNGTTNIIKEPKLNDALKITSLEGIMDYVTSGIDFKSHQGKLTLHVEDPTSITLYQDIDNEMERIKLLTCEAFTSKFKPNEWYQHEQFIISLLSNFTDTDDKTKLVEMISKISIEDGVESADDGVTQKITARKGVSLKYGATLPGKVVLSPIRTFVEVNQPLSEFVFRVKEQNGQILCALFDADGGFWKIEAMRSIKAYLLSSIVDQVTNKDYEIKILI